MICRVGSYGDELFPVDQDTVKYPPYFSSPLLVIYHTVEVLGRQRPYRQSCPLDKAGKL